MAAASARQCRQGHSLSGENLYLWVSPNTGVTIRHCRICRETYRRVRYQANREKLIAYAQDYRKADPARAKHADRKQALRRYNITPETYETMLAAQNGGCAICGSACVSGLRLAVDHDHDTNKVRGLLCMKCNRGIGLFCDQKGLLTKAIAYLELHRTT